MKRILNYLIVLLMITPYIFINVFGNTPKFLTLANPSVFDFKEDWISFDSGSLETESIIVSGENSVGGLFYNKPFTLAGSENKGFNAYFSMTHTVEKGIPRVPVLSEGLVIVFAKELSAIGSGGDGKGYFGMNSTLGIELDLISQTGDFAEPHLADRIISNGANPLVHNGVRVDSILNFKNIHIWIDYSEALNRSFVYVNTQPSKPLNPTTSYDSTLLKDFLDDDFYLGITSATSENTTVVLNSAYFSSNYDVLGIDPFTYQYITDDTKPSAPNFNISKTGTTYNVSILGSVDDVSGIFEYQYSYNNETWNKFNPGAISIDMPTFVYARAVDRAGNVSSVSTQRFFEVEFIYGVIKERDKQLFHLGQNFPLTTIFANSTDYISSWIIANTTTQIQNINQLDRPVALIGQTSRHLYNISYISNGGTLPENLPTRHSIIGQNYILPEATKVGFKFVGWFNNNVKVETLNNELVSNITLEAKFEPLSTTLTLYDVNNNVTSVTFLTEGVIKNLPTLSVPEGYVFHGFYTQPFGQGTKVDTNTFIENAHTFRIYAHITPVDANTAQSNVQTLNLIQNNEIQTNSNIDWVIVFPIISLVLLSLYVFIKRYYHAR